MTLEVKPEDIILKNNKTSQAIFGIPIAYEDIFLQNLLWRGVASINEDQKVDIREKFESSTI